MSVKNNTQIIGLSEGADDRVIFGVGGRREGSQVMIRSSVLAMAKLTAGHP